MAFGSVMRIAAMSAALSSLKSVRPRVPTFSAGVRALGADRKARRRRARRAAPPGSRRARSCGASTNERDQQAASATRSITAMFATLVQNTSASASAGSTAQLLQRLVGPTYVFLKRLELGLLLGR